MKIKNIFNKIFKVIQILMNVVAAFMLTAIGIETVTGNNFLYSDWYRLPALSIIAIAAANILFELLKKEIKDF